MEQDLSEFLDPVSEEFGSNSDFQEWKKWLIKLVKGVGSMTTQGGEPWYGSRGVGKAAYFHMHIPKCAGYSLINDTVHSLPPGTGFLSSEVCHHDLVLLNTFYRGNGLFSLLRKPQEHVYSMFFECANTRYFETKVPNDKKPILENVTLWLRHFTEKFTRDNLGCYHPLNMQTRYFTCRYSIPPVRNPTDEAHNAVSQSTNLENALRSMDATFVIGLVEHYQESLCLFIGSAVDTLPDWCNCEDKKAWNRMSQTRYAHGVPQHSISDLSEEDLRMVEALTKDDAALYAAAERRFITDIRRQEHKHGIKILCDG